MAFAYCPECVARLYLGRKPWLGQPVICEHCDADLEVVKLNPPELDWVDDVTDRDWEGDLVRELQEA